MLFICKAIELVLTTLWAVSKISYILWNTLWLLQALCKPIASGYAGSMRFNGVLPIFASHTLTRTYWGLVLSSRLPWVQWPRHQTALPGPTPHHLRRKGNKNQKRKTCPSRCLRYGAFAWPRTLELHGTKRDLPCSAKTMTYHPDGEKQKKSCNS